MRHISQCLPGFAQPKTYASWPVWRDSTTKDVKFTPIPKKEAASWYYKAENFDEQTHTPGKHGGVIGPVALKVLNVLIFVFLKYETGCLDPAIKTIAKKAKVCPRSVSTAIKRLRDLGLLQWQRRCREDRDEDGRFRLRQQTNAYRILPPSHWKEYREPPPPPIPEPGTWGDHPPLPDTIAQAIDELVHRQRETMLNVLTDDIHNTLAMALARYGRAIEAREKSTDLSECNRYHEPLPRSLNHRGQPYQPP